MYRKPLKSLDLDGKKKIQIQIWARSLVISNDNAVLDSKN